MRSGRAWGLSSLQVWDPESIKVKRKRKRAHGGCLWLSEAMKDVISCEKPR